MMDFIKKLLSNDKIRYLIAGGCTTAVNFVTFFLLRHFTDISRNISNVIAVSAAIAFAYFANKYFVFRSRSESMGRLFIEVMSFIGARLIAMAVEVIGLSLLCDSFRLNEAVAKVAVQVAVVVINYVFSKIFVFNGDKRGLRERLAKNYSWLLASLITFILMLCVIIVGKVSPFGDRSLTVVDSLHQYLPFFSDYQDKLKNEGNMFYTWDIGLGVNFMSLFMYYLASPLNLLIILFNRTALPAVMSFIAAIKISVSAMTFGYFLSRRRGRVSNNYYITSFGTAYALSSFVIGYYWNIMWMDCIMIFPLIILGFERMMEERDIKLYALSLFYCMYCNYYIAFIICIFLVLWFLAYSHRPHREAAATEKQWVEFPDENTPDEDLRQKGTGRRIRAWVLKFIQDGIVFGGASLLAAGMAAFSLIASYLAIMTTASADAGFPEHSWYGNIFIILKQHLILSTPIKTQSFDGGANLYCGIFTILLLAVWLFSDRVTVAEKLRKSLLIILLVASFNSTLLNFIWHGFHNQYGIPNRFAFVYIFVLLYIGYESVGRLKSVHTAYIISGLFLTLAFFLMCRYEAGEFERDKIMLALSMALAVLYAILMIIRKKRLVKGKIISVITSLVFLTEILANAAFGFSANGNADTGYYMQHAEKMEYIVDCVSEYSEEQGYGFYREELCDAIMLDEATLNNMKSVGTFCSTVRGETVSVMSKLGFYTAANEYLYLGATPVTASMLGVRYLYVREGEYFSDYDTMEQIISENGVSVYENKYTLPIAYAVDSSIYEWDRNLGRQSDCQNNFLYYAARYTENVFTEKSLNNVSLYSSSGCSLSYDDGMRQISYAGASGTELSITASFLVPEDGDYYMNLRGNGMNNLTYYVNGVKLADGRYHMQMFHIGNLQKNDSVTIDIEFASGFAQSGTLTANLSVFDTDAFEECFRILNSHPLCVEEWDDGYILGSVSVDSDMTLFTSIPYDEGWHVYVDGRRTEPKKVGEAFLAVDIGAGEHEIEMVYYPDGLFYGISISALAWIIFLFIIGKKRLKTVENDQL